MKHVIGQYSKIFFLNRTSGFYYSRKLNGFFTVPNYHSLVNLRWYSNSLYTKFPSKYTRLPNASKISNEIVSDRAIDEEIEEEEEEEENTSVNSKAMVREQELKVKKEDKA